MMTVWAMPVMAADPQISDTLEPSHVAVGEPAQLTVTIAGGSAEQPRVAARRWTRLHADGTGPVSLNPSNGVATSSTSQTYLVTAKRTGRFTIPALKIKSGANGEKTRPIVLEVTGATSGAGTGSRGPRRTRINHRPRHCPHRALPAPTTIKMFRAMVSRRFSGLVTPMQPLHVGELVPVRIKAYFRDGLEASINGLPSLSSDALHVEFARR